MNYFLSVLHPLFLLFTVSSSKPLSCRDQITVSGGTKEASQTGFHYGLISTPHFPEPFHTPFQQTWVIDASHHGSEYQINLYLTQMYLSKGVRFFQRATPSCDKLKNKQRETKGRHECKKSQDQLFPEIHVDKLYDVLRVSTTCPYLEIQVDVPYLYGYHYRTRDPLFFHVYGFNITYEIVPESVGIRNDSCYTRNCSNLGHCYLAENWRDSFCDCLTSKSSSSQDQGKYCEWSPFCDPQNNVTFCENGGKCRIFGSGDGYCDCHSGFTGVRCETRIEQPKVQARTGCSNVKDCPLKEGRPSCNPEASSGPCSCRPDPKGGRKIPDNWVKYEGRLEISSNYDVLLNQKTIGYEIQRNISNWFKANDVTISNNSVYVRFQPPMGAEAPYAKPQKLLIHFQGPLSLNGTIRLMLRRWLNMQDVNEFYNRIPFLKETFELYAMPRLQFKSFEVSKKERLIISKPVGFTCTAITGSSTYYSERDIRFRWFKDGVPVNKSIAMRSRGMNFYQSRSGDDTMSVMLLDQVSPFDGGKYTCEVTDLEFGDQECGILHAEITLPPQIEVEPKGLTLEKHKLNLSEVIICTDGSYSSYNPHNKSTELDWFRGGSTKERVVNNDVVVSEDIFPQGKLLRILKAEHSESFTCSGFSQDGGERFQIVKVNVLDSKHSPDSCNPQYERLVKSKAPLWWEWTALGSVAMKNCPEGFFGYVQRPCVRSHTGKVQWGRSDFSRCISDTLFRINMTLQNAERGFGDWRNVSAMKLMEELRKYVSSNQILYSGEGEKIIGILAEIVKYAFDNGQANNLFDNFFETVLQFLKTPNSCVHEESVHILCTLVAQMGEPSAMQAAKDKSSTSPHVNASDVLFLQVLPISADAKYRNYSYTFPAKEELSKPALSWLKNKVHVDFPLDSDSFRKDAVSPSMYYLIMAAYKNLSSLLAPNDIFPPSTGAMTRNRPKRSFTTTELISPVVQISMHDSYYLPSESDIRIRFNLSREHLSLASGSSSKMDGDMGSSSSDTSNSPVKGTYFSCGVLDNSSFSTKTDHGGLRWKLKACPILVFKLGSYVECQCGRMGVFGLLKVSHIEDEMDPEMTNDIPRIIISGFSFCILSCILSAAVLCIYLRCRISPNSLYALKLLDCVFVFSAVFIVLLGRTEMPSISWLTWSTSACSFLISSLCVQVTKTLRILLLEAKPDLPRFIFPWLKNVSQLTLLSAITFSTGLPMWTVTVAKMVSYHARNESAFEETSHIFAVFVGTVGLVVLAFLGIYYKAYLKTRGELDRCQQQNQPASMLEILNYRMKTLNRSLCLTLILLVMILAIILYENLRTSNYIQYFQGFSAIAMGIALVFCYVSHSEYPIFDALCSRAQHSEKPMYRDPEKETPVSHSNGSQRKLYHISSSEMTGNGSIRGTSGLLLPPPPPQVNRNLGRHGEEESEAFSVSTVEEQSMDTFSTEVSYRVPVPVPLSHVHSSVQSIPTRNHRKKSTKSTGSNTISSSAGSYRSQNNPSMGSESVIPVMETVRCGLTIGTGDYIYPSNPQSRPWTQHNGMSIPRPESSAGSASNCNYIPITDNHNNEDFKKINDNLSEIFD